MMVLSGIKCLQVQHRGVSHDLETGCPQLAIVNFMGVLFFKGDHSILRSITTINRVLARIQKLGASN